MVIVIPPSQLLMKYLSVVKEECKGLALIIMHMNSFQDMITINLTSATHIALLINILVHLGK
jgi:hypothetical protein